MVTYLARRLGLAVITLWILSIIIFLAGQVLPGDPGRAILGPFASPVAVANLDHQLGVDRPLLAPHQPELIAAHLLRPLSDGLEPGRSAATVAVNCLAPARRPFGRVGHFALVTGLASAEPDTRVTAASAWTRVVQDGRLDPVLAADAITLG